VVTSAGRLSELVQNLLVLARPGSVTQVEAEPTLVRAVIQNACEQFRERRGQRALIFDSMADDAVVMGSKIYLEQVVLNLLSNADKYSPPEEPITITLRAERSAVSISVEDRGPGLDADEVEHLCEPYYRGEQARKLAGGFGLGLAVCKRLAETMRGDLSYRGIDGRGASFTVTLPRATLDLADEPAERTGAGARAAR
jgi:signal transduction histidine kinase